MSANQHPSASFNSHITTTDATKTERLPSKLLGKIAEWLSVDNDLRLKEARGDVSARRAHYTNPLEDKLQPVGNHDLNTFHMSTWDGKTGERLLVRPVLVYRVRNWDRFSSQEYDTRHYKLLEFLDDYWLAIEVSPSLDDDMPLHPLVLDEFRLPSHRCLYMFSASDGVGTYLGRACL